MNWPWFNPNASLDRSGSKLPHWQQANVPVFVTFRLRDALPQTVIAAWRNRRDGWLQNHPKPWSQEIESEYERLFTEKIEEWLDAGIGACILREPKNRKIVADCLFRSHPRDCLLHSFVLMPNHVHVCFAPAAPLAQLLKTWKGVTARLIGKGSIWQANYRDTLIRNETHYLKVRDYIRNNPVGLEPSHYTLWKNPEI